MANAIPREWFQCPKCLQQIPISANIAGTRIECPHCSASLSVPNSIGANDLFDDLFDEPQKRTGNKAAEQPISKQSPVISDQRKRKQSESMSGNPAADRKERKSGPPPETTDNDGGADPFAYEDSKSLRIEGVSDNILASDSFYFSCPTCDSKIQVRATQLGERVKCGDCYSTVTIEKPKGPEKRIDIWTQPATMKVSDDDDFRLEPPIERPDVTGNMQAGFGLGNVQDDLLAPRAESGRDATERQKTPAAAETPKKVRSNSPPAGPSGHSRQSGKSIQPIEPKISPAPKQKKQDSSAPAEAIQFQQLLRLEFGKDLDLLIRTVVTIVFLAVGYTMIESISTTWAMEGMNPGEKFGKLFPAMLAAPVCIGVAGWFLTITYSVLMRAVANGQTRIEEWVGFAPAEWFGLFAITAFGIWAAMLPGVLLGYFAWSATGWFFFLPMLTAVSVFALSPLFLISSFFNESVFNIFSPEIAKTFSEKKANWPGAYSNFAITLGVFVIGIAVTFLPSLLFSLIGAAVQVIAIMALAALTGLHARSVIQVIQSVRPS